MSKFTPEKGAVNSKGGDDTVSYPSAWQPSEGLHAMRITTAEPEIFLFSHGTKVLIGDDIPGVVNGVMIRGKRVLYEIAWWNGRTREEKWLDAHEVRLGGDTTLERIGFVRS